jgi:hypothetical protein
MRLILAGLFLAFAASSAHAASHPCEKDAIDRAGKLLKLHWQSDGMMLSETGEIDDTGEKTAWSVDETAKKLAPIKALQGKGKFDVLEVNGAIIKATYRMRFIYAQIPDSCVLMGQEILEVADPY